MIIARNRLKTRWAFLVITLVHWLSGPLIPIFFLFHHALSEAYIDAEKAKLGMIRFFYNLIISFFIVRSELNFAFGLGSMYEPISIFLGLSSLSLLFAIVKRVFYSSRGSSHFLYEHVKSDCLLMLVAAISLFFYFSIIHIALYHFIFWAIHSISLLEKSQTISLKHYFIFTFGLMTFFIFISPLVWNYDKFEKAYFDLGIYFLTSVHVIGSLFISKANPLWIRKAVNL